MHGVGVLKYENGDIYEGTFTNDLESGNGKYTYADGVLFYFVNFYFSDYILPLNFN